MANTKFENIWKIMREYELEMEDDVSKELICSICKKVMIKSCNSPCECRYCYECIRKYLDEGNRFCPGQLPDCRDEMINMDESIHIDNVINSKVSKLIVKCPLEFCEYRDELRKIEDHIRTCTAKPVNCLYHNIGCRDTKSPGDKMKDHLVKENYAHTKYLVEWIDNVTNEMGSLRKYVGELQGEINDLKEKDRQNQMANKSMKEEINNLQKKDKTTKIEVVELRTKSDEQSRQIDQWKKKCDDTNRITNENDLEKSKLTEEIHQTKADLVSKLDQIDLSIKDVEKKSGTLEDEMCKIKTNLVQQNEFVWTIQNISNKIKQAKDGIVTEISSKAFYSHRNGYKMCLELHLNEDHDGSYLLSLYFHLMKGPFDDFLSWPFMHDVTFSLMNQQSGLVYVSETIEYDDNPNDSCIFTKPINNRNAGWGCREFIDDEELLSNAALIKNNQIIIKCSVSI